MIDVLLDAIKHLKLNSPKPTELVLLLILCECGQSDSITQRDGNCLESKADEILRDTKRKHNIEAVQYTRAIMRHRGNVNWPTYAPDWINHQCMRTARCIDGDAGAASTGGRN